MLALGALALWALWRERMHRRHARSLQQHITRLQATLQAVPDAMCLLDTQGRCVDALRLIGVSTPPFPASVRDLLREPIAATLQTGEVGVVECEWSTEWGIRRFEVRLHALEVPTGDTAPEEPRVLALARDVTEHHAADERLRASEARFRGLLQNISSVAVQGYRVDGSISYWNRASEKLYGYTEAEVLGRNLLETLVPLLYQAQVQEALRTMHETGEVLPAQELVMLHSHGHEVPVLSSYAAIEGATEHAEFFRFDIDLTERKRTEAELRVAATAFEAQEGMMVTNARREILRVNQAFTRISGFEDHEVIGRLPTMFSSGWHDNAFYQEMNETLLDKGTWEGEIWNRRKNGEVYPQWLHITAVTDDTGAVSHYVATVTDITQRKAAEDQIRQLAFYITDCP